MNAIVKEFPGEEGTFFRTNIEEKHPGYGQVKIKVMAASICASDVHALYNGLMADRYRYPVTIGHEGAGIVTEIGEGVTSIQVGDRVTAETTLETCGTCEYCRKAQYNLCAHRKGLGSVADGYFAESVIAAERACHKLAEETTYEEGALAEPLACTVHATCNLTNPLPGDVALVVGPGPIGTMVAALLKLSGCIVVMSGINGDEARMAFAREHYGIQHTVNSMETDLKAYLDKLTDGRGPDYVYECSGSRPGIVSGMELCKKKGTYVAVAMNSTEIPLDYYKVVYTKEITILGDKSTNPITWERTMRIINNHLIDLNPLISARIPMSQWKEGYELTRSGKAYKVIMLPQEG